MPDDYIWWKHGVIYQIYPRSFMDSWYPCPDRSSGGSRVGARCDCGKFHDSNGDGIGDLQGVVDRLDYLNDGTERSLGIDAIWFSPTFPSPMKDFGYDVSDYCGVHPDFGDLATIDRLIAACHRRGIKVILDYVPNHSSDQHPWFIESRGSRDNPKRDWYVWRDAQPDGGPPNNWISFFGGSTWEWDEATGQYYLHLFLKEQPDLNWRNPAVVREMHDVLRFWMARGVDGFRMDVVGMILKDPLWRDNPPNPDARPDLYGEAHAQLHVYNVNHEDVYEEMRALRRVLDEYPERMAVGEIIFGNPERLGRFLGGEALDGLHLAFNFSLLHATWDREGGVPWDARRIRALVDGLEAALPRGAWPNYVLGNHDVPRLLTRLNADGNGPARARVAAMLLLTLRGTPFIYYGEEIGMEDVAIPEARLQDPARFREIGRDPERTPMQWDASPGRGFTTGEPWLPFGDPPINVADQIDDPTSLFALYRRLIRVRHASPALTMGSYRPIEDVPAPVYAYLRETSDERMLVALNFSREPQRLTLPEGIALSGVVLSSDPSRASALPHGAEIILGRDEGLILELARETL